MRVERALDAAADHSGNLLLLALTIVGVAAIVAAVAIAVITQTWVLLAVLIVPAVWAAIARS